MPQQDSPVADNSVKVEQRSFVRTILRYFVSGTIVLLPLVVTVAIVLWLSNFFITWFGPTTVFGKVLSRVGIKFVEDGFLAWLFGWGVVLVALFLIGFLTEVVVRQTVIQWFDAFIKKIPLIGMIYGTIRKITDLVNKSGKDEVKNMSPVYCRFGSANGGVMILALLPSNKEYLIEDNIYYVVIIPTAPVPFGGGMFFMPKKDVFPAPMSIDEFMGFYVTMGVNEKQDPAKIPTAPVLNPQSLPGNGNN
ncbi:MAG: DUF502 domain-containing protein [Planctomycetia bacterium]|nr:DUF502 domain-containing protein [Planctomycetia bacterium]